ncbi:hypothetical protein ONZ45_g2329 [Pleurotus djamor]|nr:hypothetical protein ONZ45_g2329 [Pleurotus djamor]
MTRISPYPTKSRKPRPKRVPYQRKFSALDCATLEDSEPLEPPTETVDGQRNESVDASKGDDMFPGIVHGNKEQEEDIGQDRVGQSEESESIRAKYKLSQTDMIQILKEFEEMAVSADRGDWMEGERCAAALRQLRARLVKEMKDDRRW